MLQITIEEIKRDFPSYLGQVEKGETVIILRAGKPIAEFKPLGKGKENLRPFGLCAGEFVVPDSFDAPLPENLLNEFEG